MAPHRFSQNGSNITNTIKPNMIEELDMATDVFQNFAQAGGVCVIPISRDDASKIQGGAKPLPDSHS